MNGLKPYSAAGIGRAPRPGYQRRAVRWVLSPRPSPLPEGWSLPTSRTVGHRDYFVCAGRPQFWCPEGTIENSPAFQRWVGRRKVASPEGTPEPQSRNPSISRPFGTCLLRAMFPGVKTPGYSQDVPPGQRNLVAAFSAKKAIRLTSDVFKAISRPRCLASEMWDRSCLRCPPKRMGDMFSPWGEGEPFSPLRTIQTRRLSTARCSLSLRERVRMRGNGAAYRLACRTIPGNVEPGESSGRAGDFPK